MRNKVRAVLILLTVLIFPLWVLGQQAPPAGGHRRERGAGAGQGRRGPGGPGGRGAAPRTKKVVLAWADTRNGIAQHESVSHAIAVIERIGYESGLYDTQIRTDSEIISYSPLRTDGKTPASGGPNLGNVDAIFFCGHREVPLDDAGKAALVKFIKEDGKGFVGAHVGLTAFESWPEFANIIGGGFVGHVFGNAGAPLINERPDFPATRHYPPTLEFADEYYLPGNYSRETIDVLQRIDVSGFSPNERYPRTDGDYPVTWAKMYGKGRVFYSSLGHDTRTWDNTDVSRYVLRGDQVGPGPDRRTRQASSASGRRRDARREEVGVRAARRTPPPPFTPRCR